MNLEFKMGAGGRRYLSIAILLLQACVSEEPRENVAGSGTELGNVIGTILDSNQVAAQGIDVVLYPLNGDTTGILKTKTNSRGAFGFQALPVAYRLISTDGQGNGLTIDSIKAQASARLDLSSRILEPLGGISGNVQVIGSRGGEVELRLLGSPYTFRTNPNSSFDWRDIPAGQYWLQAYYPGAASVEVPVRIEPGQSIIVTDTLRLTYNYTFGVSRSDTIVLSSADVPYTAYDRLYADNVDSVYWVLNGTGYPLPREDWLAPVFFMTQDMLLDSGSNLLELRILMPDTAVARQWHIVINDSTVTPWPFQAVRAVFLSKKPSPRPNKPYLDIGRFKILERRLLSNDELAFWNEVQISNPDTAIPGEIEVPLNYQLDFQPMVQCGVDTRANKIPSIPYLPGDTLTFFLIPDSIFHAMAIRTRDDERFEDMAKMAWFAHVHWPLAELVEDWKYSRFSQLAPSFRPEGIYFRKISSSQYTSYFIDAPTIDNCASLDREYLLDSTATIREIIAVPPGFSSASLLLHFRNLMEGVMRDTVPKVAAHVYIDSSGKGITGENGAERSFQLDSIDLSELQGILASLPNPIPAEWEGVGAGEYLVGPHLESTKYLFSDGRGVAINLDGHTSVDLPNQPPTKAGLVLRVDTWLRSKGFL